MAPSVYSHPSSCPRASLISASLSRLIASVFYGRDMTTTVPSSEPLGEATRRVERGEPVVLATVIRVDGNPPCRPGQKLLVAPSGALAGTLGCPGFDARTV